MPRIPFCLVVRVRTRRQSRPYVLPLIAVPENLPLPEDELTPETPTSDVTAAAGLAPSSATPAALASPADSVGPDPSVASVPAPAIPELPPAACAARLAELFPALFTPGAPKPLKLRIQADIQQRAPGIFTKKSLSIFLHRHTTNTAYLRAMVASPQRIDLNGAPAGDVADEHRQAATAELERRRTLFEERRAAEREAQRKLYDEQRKQHEAQRKLHGTPPETPGDAPGDAPRQAPRRPPRDAPRATPRDPRRQPHEAPRNRPEVPRQPHEAPRMAVDEPPRQPSADDAARRERQMLVRAYEGSTLTKANFCVLKGLTEAHLDAALAQARQDPPPPQQEPRPNERSGQRPDARGARPSAPPRSNRPQGSPTSHRRSGRP